jgi:anti-sigma regulatory factor (Ser/Thr protein kinase)
MKAFFKNISLYWKCQLIGWGLYCLNDLIGVWSFFGANGDELTMPIFTLIIGLPVSHLMRTVLVKLKVTQKSVRLQVFYFLCITLVFAVIGGSLETGLVSLFYYGFVGYNGAWGRYIMMCNGAFSTFLYWNFIYFTYHYVQNVRKKDKAKIEMQYKIFELEAFALRATMNPHFIYNCLNSIKSLIQQNENEKSVTYLTTFSKLIRTLLNNADKKEISLFDEIETCKLYLQLEKMRFDSRFSYAVNVENYIDLKSIQVPALIVQPFIENAIWHGIMARDTGGHVLLNVFKKNDMIEVVVEDDGIGREASQQNKSTSGLAHQSRGISLTLSRLELNNQLLQRQAKLQIIDKKDENGMAKGTTVIVKLKEELS